ncbi:MAG: acyl-CoA dehydrogenase family protein, partial [Myxococcales bacterium]|nr:acyl-CoA dehydrogenase family protein [Myxococcales bacterium]
MDFSLSPQEEAFRQEVRAFIAANNPKTGDLSADSVEDAFANLPKLFEWNAKLHEKGWVGFTWPKEYGG